MSLSCFTLRLGLGLGSSSSSSSSGLFSCTLFRLFRCTLLCFLRRLFLRFLRRLFLRFLRRLFLRFLHRLFLRFLRRLFLRFLRCPCLGCSLRKLLSPLLVSTLLLLSRRPCHLCLCSRLLCGCLGCLCRELFLHQVVHVAGMHVPGFRVVDGIVVATVLREARCLVVQVPRPQCDIRVVRAALHLGRADLHAVAALANIGRCGAAATGDGVKAVTDGADNHLAGCEQRAAHMREDVSSHAHAARTHQRKRTRHLRRSPDLCVSGASRTSCMATARSSSVTMHNHRFRSTDA